MKKFMKFTAMLASGVMLCSAVAAAPVSALYCWGSASGEDFQDMTLLDDKGIFAGIPTGSLMGTADNYQVYTCHYENDREIEVYDDDTGEMKKEMRHYESNPIYVICPREKYIQFTMREGLDKANAENQMLEILQKYYPDIQDRVHNPGSYRIHSDEPVNETTFASERFIGNDNAYDVVDLSETAGSAEISDNIMRDLADAGLISEFYTWGQTANYIEVSANTKNCNPTVYYPTGWKWNEDYTKQEPVYYDWDAIEAYVKEHYPECAFVHVTLEDTEIAKTIGYYDYEQDKVFFGNDIDEMYAVIPPDGTAFPAHFAIAVDLEVEFGISCGWVSPESASSPLIGQNSLAVAGDVNLDCSIDISDTVLLARFCAEDSAVTITETGQKNADANADGSIALDDVTEILRKIAKL